MVEVMVVTVIYGGPTWTKRAHLPQWSIEAARELAYGDRTRCPVDTEQAVEGGFVFEIAQEQPWTWDRVVVIRLS